MDTLVDIGTFVGFSAHALSCGGQHVARVITYDVVDCIPREQPFDARVERRIGDCVRDLHDFIGAPLIVLDVDPHDGRQEQRIVDALRENGYRGIVLCDDIHLNDDMRRWWSGIGLKKLDVTRYGHWSGSGIIVFDESWIDVIVA